MLAGARSQACTSVRAFSVGGAGGSRSAVLPFREPVVVQRAAGRRRINHLSPRLCLS